MTWTAAQVAAALGIPITHAGEYGRVSTDTRQIGAGDLFVALKGDRFDAHDFLADAKGKGAAAAVVRRGTTRVDGLPVFEVADTLVALG
ncbi:MAG TPA: Mur ligase domain-containing protein, partial [Gemmatimonadales bacterium]|nr:Mur ligase domain-containing protein [Gemmatimonadales bacterium]